MGSIAATLLCLARPAAGADEQLPPVEKEFTACHRYPENKKFHWAVRGEVGVPELVASLGEISCQSILYSPQVAQRGGKVTLETPDLVSAADVFHLFQSALEVMGLTLEPGGRGGRTLKVVDAGRGREVARLARGALPDGEQFVTRLLPIAHASPQEVAEIAGKLRGKEGDLSVFASGSALVLTDRASNVRRIAELVQALDVAEPRDRRFAIAVHGGTASELAATMEKILQAGRRPEAGRSRPQLGDGVTALVPVDWARLVIIIGSDAGCAAMQKLAQRLDPSNAEADLESRSHVIYLAHTNAEEMAATLREMNVGARNRDPKAGGGGEIKIAADKNANAMVVFAGSGDFAMVRDLVGKLDLPRRQVYVEATILDVSVDRARDLGLSLHGGQALGDSATGFVGSRGTNNSSLILGAASLAAAVSGAGLTAGVLGKSFEVLGVSVPSFGVMLHALERNRDVNVLSRPHLLTMDNTKASLSVGQSIPFPTGSLASQASGLTQVALATSYNRQDVALKLELTPHLNDSDSIRLELDGEISDVPDGQSGQAGGPTTNKRTLKTAIVVNDGETIVLGGLQKEGESQTIDKTPILGDIPLLGRLFQTRSRQRTKQDLLIVLTPHIIRGPDDLRRIFERKERERREFLERETAFADRAAFSPTVDWARKRGLLAEIEATARAAEREAAAIRVAQRQLQRPASGPID